MLTTLVVIFLVIFAGFNTIAFIVFAWGKIINQLEQLKGDPLEETWFTRITRAGLSILGALFLGWFAFLMLFLARQSINDLIYDSHSSNWPTTAGRITSSTLKSWEESGSTYFQPEIEYEYEVEDRNYSSSRIRFGGFVPSLPYDSALPQQIIVQYPTGLKVQVFFKADDPSVSVLEPGVGRIRILLILAMWIAIFVFTGLFAGWCLLNSINHLRWNRDLQ